MSCAFEQDSQGDPFNASYEEYVRTFQNDRPVYQDPFANPDADEVVEDDPEVTQASTNNVSAFAARDAGEDDDASWSGVTASRGNDPFATQEDDGTPS